jgi:hypothetical protein
MKRANGADIPSEFGRIPIPITGGSTLFPNWTIESWLDFMTVHLHLFLWYFPFPFHPCALGIAADAFWTCLKLCLLFNAS